MGGQTQNIRNGGPVRIPALGGVEMGEKSSGINTLRRRDDLLLKKRVSSDKIISLWPTHIPPGFGIFLKHKSSTACQINILIENEN